jgi:hypothetical protein
LPVSEERLLQGAKFRANQHAGSDIVPLEPAVIDFQDIADPG